MKDKHQIKIFKTLKNIIINSIIIILSIIAILAIIISIQLNIQNKEYANICGYSIFKTLTGSMSPTIEKGDIVIVKLVNDVEINDIVTYKKQNNFITHRLVKTDQDKFILKGDFNNTEDQPIEKQDIIGKVVFTIKNVEVWKKVFTDIRVIIPLFVTLLLITVLILYNEKTGEKDEEK